MNIKLTSTEAQTLLNALDLASSTWREDAAMSHQDQRQVRFFILQAKRAESVANRLNG